MPTPHSNLPPDDKQTDRLKAYMSVENQLYEQMDTHYNQLIQAAEDLLSVEEKHFRLQKQIGDRTLSGSEKVNLYVRNAQKLNSAFNSVKSTIKVGMLDQLTSIPKIIKDFNLLELLGHPFQKNYWANLIKQSVGKIGPELGAIFLISEEIFRKFKQWDDAISLFRQDMGIFRDYTIGSTKPIYQISRDMEDIVRNTARLGVNIGTVIGAYESLAALSGGIWNVNKELVKTISAMSVSLGVSQDVSTGMLRNFAVMAGTTMDAQVNSLLFAQSLSNAAGVSFNQIAIDLGKANDNVLMLSRRGVPSLIKSAVELRRMGSSMDEAADSASHLLDFTQSINDEMDASVLLGRSINLQRVRELDYAGDLAGATKQIVSISKQVDFSHLDYFQKGAFAKAVGMSVGQLNNLLQTDKEIGKALRSQDPTVRAMAQKYKELQKSSQSIQVSEAEKQKQTLMTQSNLSRTASISASWNQIVSKLAYIFLPAIDKVLAVINWVMGGIADNVTAFSIAFGAVWLDAKEGFTILTHIGKSVELIGEKLFFWGMSKNWKWLEITGNWVNKLGGGVIKTAKLLVMLTESIFSKIPFVRFIPKMFASMEKLLPKFVTRFGEYLGKEFGKSVQIIPNIITKLINGLVHVFGDIAARLGGTFGRLFGGLAARFGGIATRLSGLFGGITARLGAVLKFVGRIAIPLMFAWNIFKRIRDLLHDPALMGTKGFFAFNGKLIIRAFGVIIGALWDTFNDLAFGLPKLIVKGFVWVGKELWGVVKGWSAAIWGGLKDFIGFSPSVLGKRIVNGIASVGGMILGALVSPFRRVFSMISPLFSIGMLISKGISSAGSAIFSTLTNPFKTFISWVDRIPFLGGIANKLGMGSKSMGAPTIQHSVEHKAQAAYIPAVTVSPAGTKIETSSSPNATKERKAEETKNKYTIDDLYEELCKLNRNLKSGKIRSGGISLDTSLVSTTIARQTEFKGAYGVNRI